MVSTSEFCPNQCLERRSDLVIRPLPEIRMCMVYRPRPALMVSLNPSSWMLLELCNGSTVDQIVEAYSRLLAERGRRTDAHDVYRGLKELVQYRLITGCPTNNGDGDRTKE